MEFDLDAIEDEDSPYPEVRASVSNIDDPDMPTLTIRMWLIGLFLCMIGGALNVFFNFRSPAPSIVPLTLLLISYPMGKFLAFILPITTYRFSLPSLPSSILSSSFCSSLPLPLLRLIRPLTIPRVIEFSFNPGPWNIKEHALVYIMANVAASAPYALNAIVTSQVFYGLHIDYWFSLVLVLATQLTGFGLAGLCRRFLVWPASMVWPQNLVACALLNTLHAEDEEEEGVEYQGRMSMLGWLKRPPTRYRFFMMVTFGSFLFFFLPGFLFQALSVFSFICWLAPTNVPINQLFGVHSGMGMSILTFDWTQISWIGSPLMVPWWAQVQVFLGFVFFFWILTPVLYYTNAWFLSYFPISADQPYDRFGGVYNVTRVLTPDNRIDLAAYEAYSPLFLPATYAMTYLIAFTLSTCVIVHTALYHGHTLLKGVKRMRVEADDIHAKLMRNYPEVPGWWYLFVLVAFFGLAIVAVEVWKTSVPVWALLLSVSLPALYVLPSGFIYAMTGQGITLNIIAEIIPGTLLPGNPLANMVFKAYSVQTLNEATSFVQDLKLGHYIKVAPRATFQAQLVATILTAFVQVGTKQWIFGHVKDICSLNQASSLTCPHNQVFFTASAIWGLIGPSRQFGNGSIYHPQVYAIIVGALLPFPFWLWQRRYPGSWVRWVSTPVILNGVSAIPPATGINYSSWFLVGFVFQYLIRKRNFAWWTKFNYITSAALDSGTAISLIFIFLALQLKDNIQVNWWGNDVFMNTADWASQALKTAPTSGIPARI
jgi:OPT family small oligopeptide transporter